MATVKTVSLKSAGSLNNNQQWITILTAQWVDVGNVLGNEKMKSVKKGTSRIYTQISTAICLILCTDIWSILQVLCTMHLHMQSICPSHISSHALILHLCMNQDSKYFCILSTCTFFSTKLVWNKDHFNSLCPLSFFLQQWILLCLHVKQINMNYVVKQKFEWRFKKLLFKLPWPAAISLCYWEDFRWNSQKHCCIHCHFFLCIQHQAACQP